MYKQKSLDGDVRLREAALPAILPIPGPQLEGYDAGLT